MTFVNSEHSLSACRRMLDRLREHPWFADIPDAELFKVTLSSRWLTFEPGQELFIQGQPCAGCLLVHAGQLEGLRYTEDGEEKVFGHILPGKFAALHSLFTNPPCHWHTIRARTSGEGGLLGGQAIRLLCHAWPDFAMRLIHHGAQLLHHHTEQIDWLTSSTAEQRLADYILRFGQGGKPGEAGTMKMPLSWSLIATKLGIRAETVSRVLGKWRRQGYLQRNARGALYILRPDALQALIGPSRREVF
jgi:CRP/FNR family transcriptional regulator